MYCNIRIVAHRRLVSSSHYATIAALAFLSASASAEGQSSSAHNGETATLPTVRVEDEVLVEATRYSTPKTTTATKTNTALRDVPQSISIVTSDLIKDQNMRSMADAARYVPGITMG